MSKIAKLLERLDVRCSKCRKWFSGTYRIERRLEYGTNVGGLLLMDPFYLVIKVCTCKCGHILSTHNVAIEEPQNGA